MDEKIFQVGSSDSLGTIAQTYLGNVSNFRELATFNNIDIFSQITGSTLKIPSADQLTAMVSAAIAQNNASQPLSEGIMSGLDLSGLRIGNDQFGTNSWQLISWLF